MTPEFARIPKGSPYPTPEGWRDDRSWPNLTKFRYFDIEGRKHGLVLATEEVTDDLVDRLRLEAERDGGRLLRVDLTSRFNDGTPLVQEWRVA